jgi:copper resistance protein C
MFRSRLLICGLMAVCAAQAQAHTHAARTMPAEGSTVQSPKHLMFMFSETSRLTALTVQRDGEAAQKVEPLPTAASAHVRVPVAPLSNGKYTVTWRAMGKDAHVVSGSLHFTVSDKAPAMGMADCCKQGMADKPAAEGPSPEAPAPAIGADAPAGHKH